MRATVATSLKLPVELKAAIDEDARRQGMSSHAYMVKALGEAADRSRLRERFTEDALTAEREALVTGLGHSLDEVREYFARMAEFRAGRAERPAPLMPKKLL